MADITAKILIITSMTFDSIRCRLRHYYPIRFIRLIRCFITIEFEFLICS
ncbi:MAG: hypothetical protein SPK34_07495 [Bacteroidaceae bacterium]|nr:hypothetical protein [Prevotellaceae bacterium]MDD6016705.1 hypothetical protein [Prevotellaceae bacterium]MDD7527023.1 hypothetical protein [Prevotellaceae bacterium]MDY5760761.1 hypothetical protein [Bacteroidaceae bacterium]